MRVLVAVAAILLPTAALAQPPAAAGDGFHARLYERYCEKLRESPEAYVQFVRRMQTVHGLTFGDFAPEHQGAPVKADCRVSPARAAEVRRLAAAEKR